MSNSFFHDLPLFLSLNFDFLLLLASRVFGFCSLGSLQCWYLSLSICYVSYNNNNRIQSKRSLHGHDRLIPSCRRGVAVDSELSDLIRTWRHCLPNSSSYGRVCRIFSLVGKYKASNLSSYKTNKSNHQSMQHHGSKLTDFVSCASMFPLLSPADEKDDEDEEE